MGESRASIKNVFEEMFTVSWTVSKTRVITHIKGQYYLLSGLTQKLRYNNWISLTKNLEKVACKSGQISF